MVMSVLDGLLLAEEFGYLTHHKPSRRSHGSGIFSSVIALWHTRRTFAILLFGLLACMGKQSVFPLLMSNFWPSSSCIVLVCFITLLNYF
jgi:hypothetical protein